MSQLSLPLRLQDHAIFETFWDAGNEAAFSYLAELAAAPRGTGCWLWGAPTTGKSHLLQAVCECAGKGARYLPLQELQLAGPAALEGMGHSAILCLDDLQAVAGQPAWEKALFRLLLEAADRSSTIVASAAATARETKFLRDDVGSRFAQLPSFQLVALGDNGLFSALKLRAKYRGLELPDETARFLLTRQRRDMASLYRLLDRLEGEATEAGRRLTIPFVKKVLDA